MIHVYKSGGAWKFGDKEYTVKAIEVADKPTFIAAGWVDSLEKVKTKAKSKTKAAKDDDKK